MKTRIEMYAPPSIFVILNTWHLIIEETIHYCKTNHTVDFMPHSLQLLYLLLCQTFTMSITQDGVCFLLPQKLQDFNTKYVLFFYTTFVQSIFHPNKYSECCKLVTPKMHMEMHVGHAGEHPLSSSNYDKNYVDEILVKHKFRVNPFRSSSVAT